MTPAADRRSVAYHAEARTTEEGYHGGQQTLADNPDEARRKVARSRIEELFARSEADRLVEMTDPKTGNKIPVAAKTVIESLSAEISRLRAQECKCHPSA